jgi:hypothetical protein
MNLELGVEDRPFTEAIDDELRRLAARSPDDDRWDDVRNFHSYVERSRYRPQLDRWLAHYPSDALHVTTLEWLRADPTAEIGRLCRFLGVDELRPSTAFGHANRRDYDELAPSVRRSLFALFADDVAETEALLGRPLGYRADAAFSGPTPTA